MSYLFDNTPEEPLPEPGDQCPHCKSTMTGRVDVIWEDETLTCLANTCYWCGQTFETVRPIAAETEPPNDDGIPF